MRTTAAPHAKGRGPVGQPFLPISPAELLMDLRASHPAAAAFVEIFVLFKVILFQDFLEMELIMNTGRFIIFLKKFFA